MLVRRGHPPMRVHILLRPGGKAPKSLAYGLAQHYGSVVDRFRFTPDSRPYRKLIDSSESCHLLPYAVQQRAQLFDHLVGEQQQ